MTGQGAGPDQQLDDVAGKQLSGGTDQADALFHVPVPLGGPLAGTRTAPPGAASLGAHACASSQAHTHTHTHLGILGGVVDAVEVAAIILEQHLFQQLAHKRQQAIAVPAPRRAVRLSGAEGGDALDRRRQIVGGPQLGELGGRGRRGGCRSSALAVVRPVGEVAEEDGPCLEAALKRLGRVLHAPRGPAPGPTVRSTATITTIVGRPSRRTKRNVN
jgi:hypothetical protein